MAQVKSQAISSKLFMTPFDYAMAEEDDIKPDVSSWGMSLSGGMPRFTPSDWFNPSPDLTTDYFSAPLSSQNLEFDAKQNQVNGALASFWLFPNPSESTSGSTPSGTSGTSGTSGNGSNSSLASPFHTNQPGEFNFQSQSQAGPSTFNPALYDRPNAIPTSLLVSPPKPTRLISPNPVAPVAVDSPESYEEDRKVHITPTRSCANGRAAKRRGSSYSSLDEHDEADLHDEDTYEIHEGVEKDGMIWGMKVEDYRALSARERKRVRNRISARTFRAKRKEHLSSLEIDLNAKDSQIKIAQDEASKLRKQVADLKKRLAKYEAV